MVSEKLNSKFAKLGGRELIEKARKRREELRIRRIAAEAEALQSSLADPQDIPVGQSPQVPDGLVPRPVTNPLPDNPDFGSFFGSGVLENVSGPLLRGASQVQRGVETFGGLGTSLVTGLMPGEQPFERRVREVQDERRAAGQGIANPSSLLQTAAEAFRRTDMPSADLPGEGFDLIPGKGEFKLLDTVGVKGAIELTPDALLAALTGGGSSVAKAGARGLAAATGADIAIGGAKAARQAVISLKPAPKAFWSAPARLSDIKARLQDVHSEQLVSAIESVPSKFRGLAHEAAASVSRTKLANYKDNLESAVLAHMINTARNESKISEGMSRFLLRTEKMRANGNDLKRLYVADEAAGIPAESGLLKVRNVQRAGGKFQKREPRTVFLSEFMGTVFKGDDLAKEIGENAWAIGPRRTPTLEVFDPQVNAYRALNTEELDYIRLSQDAMTETGDLLREFGMLGGNSLVSDTGELYFRRWLREVENVQGQKYGRAQSSFGKKPSSLKARTLTNEEVVQRIAEEGYRFESDIPAILEDQIRQVYRSINDKQLVDQLKKTAKTNPERVRTGVDAAGAARVRRAIKQIGKGKGIRDKTIKRIGAELGEDFIPHFEELMKIRKGIRGGTATEAEIERKLKMVREAAEKAIKESRQPAPGEYVIGGQRVAGNQLQRFFFSDEAEAARYSRLLDTGDPSFTSQVLRNNAELAAKVGDVLRVSRTGFDFGFWMIQGLPYLGRSTAMAATNPKIGLSMFADYLKTFDVAFKSFKDQEFAQTVIARTFTRDEVNDALEHGVQLSRAATDVFQGADVITDVLNRVPVAGGPVANTVRRFERAFVTPGDFLRMSYYKNMRAVAGRGPNAERNLRDLASTANKMTGALSSMELGITPTQQALERAFFFFSPRYTRSSLALIHDAVTGGMAGAEARRALFGMAGLGVGAYVTFSSLLGQDPVLDPTDSKFMTVDINGDRIGIGSFWTSFVKTLAKTGGSFDSEQGIREFMDVRQNPIMRWMRGRSAPVGGFGWDIAYQEDFLGESLEGPVDWAKHVGAQFMPLAAEAAIASDPSRGQVTGVAAEVVGLRARPLTISERRAELRDERAQAAFDKDWDELNGLQKDTLESEDEVLREMNTAVTQLRSRRGRDIDVRIEDWREQRERVESKWRGSVANGLQWLSAGVIDPPQFLELHLQPANAARRQSMEELFDKTENGQWRDVMEYYAEADFGGPELPEDVAYQHYISHVLSNPDFDDPALGIDFDARDRAEDEFRNIWGEDIFAYVKQRTQIGRASLGYKIPEQVAEYWNNRDRFRFYWEGSEQSVIESLPDPSSAMIHWEAYKDADLNTRHLMRTEGNPLYNPTIKRIDSAITKVRQALRKRNRELDAWLFRWNVGGVNNLLHEDNEDESLRFLLRDGTVSRFSEVMDNARKFQIDTV